MRLILLIFFFIVSFNLYAKTGSETGLEIPRFVSLKSNEVNLRVGPSINYPISLKYVSQNLPIEIIDEFDVWRKTRDHDGNLGWLHKSLIKGDRYILIDNENLFYYINQLGFYNGMIKYKSIYSFSLFIISFGNTSHKS